MDERLVADEEVAGSKPAIRSLVRRSAPRPTSSTAERLSYKQGRTWFDSRVGHRIRSARSSEDRAARFYRDGSQVRLLPRGLVGWNAQSGRARGSYPRGSGFDPRTSHRFTGRASRRQATAAVSKTAERDLRLGSSILPSSAAHWRRGRVAEGTGVLRRTVRHTRRAGSNPAASACPVRSTARTPRCLRGDDGSTSVTGRLIAADRDRRAAGTAHARTRSEVAQRESGWLLTSVCAGSIPALGAVRTGTWASAARRSDMPVSPGSTPGFPIRLPRLHRLTARPPGSQPGDRSSTLRGATRATVVQSAGHLASNQTLRVRSSPVAPASEVLLARMQVSYSCGRGSIPRRGSRAIGNALPAGIVRACLSSPPATSPCCSRTSRG